MHIIYSGPHLSLSARRGTAGETPPPPDRKTRIINRAALGRLDGSGTLAKRTEATLQARKIFGSGSPSGDLLLTTGIYDDPEKGPTVLHFGIDMHGQGVKVLDNWRTMGMRATGSNDIVIDGVTGRTPRSAYGGPKASGISSCNVAVPLIFPLITSAYVGVAETGA